MIEKKEIINLLDNIADMLEFRGENSFKVNAYRMGAVAVRKLDEDINDVVAKKELNKIKGIGKGLQSIIYEYCELGYSLLSEELSKDIPTGVKDLMKISGLGPKKINYLYSSLNISTIDELEKAAEKNRIANLKGFGESLQEKILEEIRRIRLTTGYVLLDTALEISNEITNKLKSLKSVKDVIPAGDIRRKKEILNSIEVLVEVENITKFGNELSTLLKYEINDGCYLITESYVPVIKVYPISKANKTYSLFLLTGGENFIKKLPPVEKSEYKSEEQIFKKIKFPYIIPEMREKEYFDYPDKKNSNLEVEDIKGLLHFHTTYSDGRNSLSDMLNAAQSKGYTYAAVCDHSKSAYYANGLSEERILLQNKEIRELSKKIDITILQGIESDILKDGSLDYSNEILSKLQFVAASVHSRFKLDKNEMTKRIINAVENPYVDILGHPTGRLLLIRESYEIDINKVLDACAANNVAVEINSNPRRLDLDWRLVFNALDKGCIITINSDAHSIAEIDLVKYGIMMGRKSGLMKEDVLNCFNKEKFINFLNKKRDRFNG